MAKRRTSKMPPEVQHLFDLLQIESGSGQEQDVADAVTAKLLHAGCKPTWIKRDAAHRQIPGASCGNLIVRIPGTRRAPRRLFMAHMDSVPLCRGAVPVLKGTRIVPAGATGLGADDRTGVACLVSAVERLLASDAPRAPLTLLFTIAEETGLHGARLAPMSTLGHPAMAFNFDANEPHEVVIGAVGAAHWQAEVCGRSAHAGKEPERGVSAALIAAKAIATVEERGAFGRVDTGSLRGTTNVGSIRGGEANNQVSDHVTVRGECRSHNPKHLKALLKTYHAAFEKAAASVRNTDGTPGRVDFTFSTEYEAFRLSRREPCVKMALAAVRDAGIDPEIRIGDYGLDANALVARGLPCVTLGTGQLNIHTVDEYVDVPAYQKACDIAVSLATAD